MKASCTMCILSTLLLACSDSTGGGPVVTALGVAAGNGQSALVGTTLPQPLQVQVLSDDVARPGAVVTWETSSGSLGITSNTTDSNGIAAAWWMLGASSGDVTVSAKVPGAQGSPVIFSATALGWVTPVVDPLTDNQLGDVTASLARPLRITAFAGGAPAEGVTVTWSTGDGTITPLSSATDRFGAAAATWTLPEAAGEVVAQVSVDRTTGLPLTFHATARAAALSQLEKVQGDNQVYPSNFPSFDLLRVRGADQYGNAVAPLILAWSVESGPVEVVEVLARGVARVAPTGEVGGAVVRAAVAGSRPMHVDFRLEARSPVPLVLLDLGARHFVSRANGSTPAVDTIGVEGQMTWVLSSSGVGDHAIGSDGGVPNWGPLSFFSYDDPAIVDRVFPEPGTYRYKDYFDPAITGTLVVR